MFLRLQLSECVTERSPKSNISSRQEFVRRSHQRDLGESVAPKIAPELAMMMLTSPVPDSEMGQFDPALQNLQRVRERIDRAAEHSGRSGSAIRLVYVTKTIPAFRISRLLEASPKNDVVWLGENRAPEGLAKSIVMTNLCNESNTHWSMIGHLQTNKVKDALAFATEIQSVDRLSVAIELERKLQSQGRSIDVLVQVNTSGEDSKFGLHPDHVRGFLEEIKSLSSLRIRGFMTLAMPSEAEAPVRACFRDLRTLRDRMINDAPQGAALTELSMGMSSDFEIAVQEGATTVRIGRAIFGERSPTPAGA
jgi:PLP dependent protein